MSKDKTEVLYEDTGPYALVQLVLDVTQYNIFPDSDYEKPSVAKIDHDLILSLFKYGEGGSFTFAQDDMNKARELGQALIKAADEVEKCKKST